MTEPCPIDFIAEIDTLTSDHAHYMSPDHGVAAIVDRETFDSQGKPSRVMIRVGVNAYEDLFLPPSARSKDKP